MERSTMKSALRNRFTQIALALLLAGIFLGVLAAQEMPKGEWRAEFQTGGETIWLQLRWVTSDGVNTWGTTAKVSEVWGLDPSLSIGTRPNVHYELRRDAGTLTFTGDFDKGVGSGKISYAPNPDFVTGMKTLGYSNLTSEQVFQMTVNDVSRDYVKQM